MNVTIEQVLSTIAACVSLTPLLALVIDIGKWAGWVSDDTSPKWSAVFNLVALIAVAITLQFFPRFDIPSLDAKLLEIVKLAALIFTYVIQIWGTKLFHLFFVRKLKITAFSHRLAYYSRPSVTPTR